jgi:uncharacterized protein (TIGR00369 family)
VALSPLADTVVGFAAVSLVPKNQHVVTAELKASYFRPGVGDKLLAKGYMLEKGRKLNFCKAELYVVQGDNEPLLIAKPMATITPAAI